MKIEKIVFHGKDQDKDIFEDYVFFSSDKNFSEDYGKVDEYKLILNNPFDTCNEPDISKLLNKVDILVDSYDDSEYASFEELEESGLMYTDTWEIFEPHMDTIRKMGYDGLIIYEGGIENYVAFNLKQFELIG